MGDLRVRRIQQSRVWEHGAGSAPGPTPGRPLQRAPSAGSSMYVQLAQLGPNPSWQSTSQEHRAGREHDFIVAGMLPNTTYLMGTS